MQVHLNLIHDKASLSFWAEQRRTVEKIDSFLHELRKKLEDQGVHIEDIGCFQGKAHEDSRPVIQQHLIDIRT